MMFIRHLAAVLWGLCVHAVRTRRIGVLVLVVLGGTVVAATLLAQAVGPLAIYPFL